MCDQGMRWRVEAGLACALREPRHVCRHGTALTCEQSRWPRHPPFRSLALSGPARHTSSAQTVRCGDPTYHTRICRASHAAIDDTKLCHVCGMVAFVAHPRRRVILPCGGGRLTHEVLTSRAALGIITVCL